MKTRANTGAKANLYGLFNWRKHYVGPKNRYHRFKSKEDYINSLMPNRRPVYQQYLDKREARWYTSKQHQRQLRLTLIHFKKLEKMKEAVFFKTFRNIKIDQTEVPAECEALLNIAILESL